MSERDLERYLVRETNRRGGMAVKWTSPAQRGVPDRIVFMPGWIAPAFVELKAPGRKPTKLQAVFIERLRGYGQQVVVIDHREQVSLLLDGALL